VDIVGEAGDGREAVRLAKTQDVDVAILDLAMPELNGIETTRVIRRESMRTRVLMVTGHQEEHQIVGALDAGVCGYVAKTDVGEELTHAIYEVFRGNSYLSSAISRIVAGRKLAGVR
jgi:DNA-binding NarL/FixJ family response regulator